MFGADKGKAGQLDGKGLRIGIVQARFNEEHHRRAGRGLPAPSWRRSAWPTPTSTTCSVPGALEVPVALQALAERGGYDALIALGCIIRGETYHFELVANESGAGVSRVALDYQLPIANAILTTETSNRPSRGRPTRAATRPASRSRWRNLLDDLS